MVMNTFAVGMSRSSTPSKTNGLDASRHRALDAQHLLRDDRQYLEFDAVELVETSPRAGRRQTLEELPHRLVVQTV